MSSFLSESYLKPKLMETRLINKIIEQENNKITFESKAISFIKDLFYTYWQIIAVLLVICGLFYWRYKEVKNIRKKNLNKNTNSSFNKSYYNNYEEDSDSESSENN